MSELKELIMALSASQQLRTPSEPPADTSPIPSIEVEYPRRPRLSESVRLPPLHEHRTPSLPRASREPIEEYYPRHKKSTISEKITYLSDGKDHTFRQWSASIRDRLLVNEDHYPTDVSRRALIWGTTTGLAKTYLEPQYLSDTHGFQSADEMMDLLGSYFLTGNETEAARNAFDDLRMGQEKHQNESFPEFKARFQSAAITGQVPSTDWFRLMWNKLTPQLRSRTLVMKTSWNSNYHTMVRELTAFDLERRRNNELLPTLPPGRRTSPPRTRKTTEPARNPTPGLYRSSTAAPAKPTFFPRSAPPDRPRMPTPAAATGNCFKCGKPGHFQDKCPLNATVKEIDQGEYEAEEQWEEALEELESDPTLEENDEA